MTPVLCGKQGVALENSTSTSQQDLQSYSQQAAMGQPPAATTHSPAGHHYIYQQPHSPVPPQSPVSRVVYFKNFERSPRFYVSLAFAEVVANAATAAQLVGLVQVLAAGEQAVAPVLARANDSGKREENFTDECEK